ncbi:MAG: NifU family protein [Flavobacteriales bacterium]|nr:NifU family protein [Flavobacteriales bacterium]
MSVADTSNIILQIEEALKEIRPFLLEDGGDVEFKDFTDGVVKVELKGACRTCSMRKMTFHNGVEETIKKAVPQVKEVLSVD